MAFPIYDKRCLYAGIVQVPIRTYTTTYPFISAGWQFNDNSFEPMEFHGYTNDLTNASIARGFQGKIIDLLNGYTSFSVGDVTTSVLNTSFGSATYLNNKIYGWAYAHGLAKNFNVFEYPLVVGANMSFPLLQFRNGVLLTNPTNTGAPAANGANGNFPTFGGGLYTSAYDNLVNKNFVYNNGGIVETDASQYGWGNAMHADHGMPYNNTNYIEVHDPSNINNTIRLMQTNYGNVNDGALYRTTYENPPGGQDINADMQTGSIPADGTITPAGFLRIFKGVIAVENKTLNGYGVIVKPDLSSYQIIQFLPRDAAAINWYTQIGTFFGKIDSQNALWMKNANSNTTLFVSAGSVVKQLPIYPPVPLPSPERETDPVPRLIRSM